MATTYTAGQTVRYTGSLRGAWGECVIVGRCSCEDCTPGEVRWVLAIPGTTMALEHVRPASIAAR